MADKNNSQPDVNEQIKVRMDKLAALQEAGKASGEWQGSISDNKV